jgi:hypothetical protein
MLFQQNCSMEGFNADIGKIADIRRLLITLLWQVP